MARFLIPPGTLYSRKRDGPPWTWPKRDEDTDLPDSHGTDWDGTPLTTAQDQAAHSSFVDMFSRVNDLIKDYHRTWNDPYYQTTPELEHLQLLHRARHLWRDRHGALWCVYNQFVRLLLSLQGFPTYRGLVEQQELEEAFDCNGRFINQLVDYFSQQTALRQNEPDRPLDAPPSTRDDDRPPLQPLQPVAAPASDEARPLLNDAILDAESMGAAREAADEFYRQSMRNPPGGPSTAPVAAPARPRELTMLTPEQVCDRSRTRPRPTAATPTPASAPRASSSSAMGKLTPTHMLLQDFGDVQGLRNASAIRHTLTVLSTTTSLPSAPPTSRTQAVFLVGNGLLYHPMTRRPLDRRRPRALATPTATPNTSARTCPTCYATTKETAMA